MLAPPPQYPFEIVRNRCFQGRDPRPRGDGGFDRDHPGGDGEPGGGFGAGVQGQGEEGRRRSLKSLCGVVGLVVCGGQHWIKC